MKCTIEIKMDNAAFHNEEESEDAYQAELARILRLAADQVELGYVEIYLQDHNGNRVGLLKRA